MKAQRLVVAAVAALTAMLAPPVAAQAQESSPAITWKNAHRRSTTQALSADESMSRPTTLILPRDPSALVSSASRHWTNPPNVACSLATQVARAVTPTPTWRMTHGVAEEIRQDGTSLACSHVVCLDPPQ